MPPPPQYAAAIASPQQGNPYQQQQPYGNQYPQMGSDPAAGTPNSMAAQHAGLANNNQAQAKTVLGMSAPNMPQNLGYPSPHYPQNPSGQIDAQQSGPYGYQHPSGQQPVQQGYAQYPQYQQGQGPYPSGSMPGYAPPNPYGGYPGGPATPLEQRQGEGKRSTLVRDILIGVAIAALVLGGFFIVKIFILDKNNDTPPVTASTIATIHIDMAAGVTADLLVDEKKIATVMDGQNIPVSAGQRHVVLAGPNGGKCEVNVKLEAGKTTPLKCQLEVKVPPPTTGSDTGSATGSAAPASGSGSGSAVPAGAGSGSAVPAKVDPKPAAAVTPPSTTDKTVAKPVTPPKVDATKVDATKVDATKVQASSDTKKSDIAKTDTKLDKSPTSSKKSPDVLADTSGKGYLAITSKPVAKILVDGTETGMSTPITGKSLALAPGKHKVTFVIGDDRYTFPVVITTGKVEQLDRDLQ